MIICSSCIFKNKWLIRQLNPQREYKMYSDVYRISVKDMINPVFNKKEYT